MTKRPAIVSAGMTQFGNLQGKQLLDILIEASTKALEAAKISPSELRGIYVSNALGEVTSKILSSSTALADAIGAKGLPAERVENGPASGSAAIRYAAFDLLRGGRGPILVVGGEKMRVAETEAITDLISMISHPTAEYPSGATMPALAAMFARLRMERYGIKYEHLAMVAVKNHQNALKNPYAHLKKPITMDDLLGKDSNRINPVVAEPLRLYDASPISDGGAAVILTDGDSAASYAEKPVEILGIGESTDYLAVQDREDPAALKAVRDAADMAYRDSGVSPSEIGVAELHDAFTILEIAISEEAGLFKPGEGHLALERGETQIAGRIPINPSGGLKARGHPLGATGVAQAVEVFWQLRGEAYGRQVKGARYGLTLNMGGFGSNAIAMVFGIV